MRFDRGKRLNRELDYSVIIPTRNRPLQLSRCLSSLATLNYPQDRFEVLVIDDGSTHPLEPVIAGWNSRLPVRLLTQSHGGPARARNRGAREASGRWLAFLDDDCEAAPGWLHGFGDTGAAPRELLGGATQNGIPHRPCSVASQILVEYVCRALWIQKDPLAFFPSNNLAVSSEDFQRIGGFSERFPLAAAEDREFCYRWSKEGGHLSFRADAVVGHFHHLTLRSFWRQHFNYGRGSHTFRQIRSADPRTRARRRRGAFYMGLFLSSLRTGRGWTASRNLLLLMLSQVAYGFGFVYECHVSLRPTAKRKSGGIP